jgi:ABC-2 type transport system permease protein
MGDGPALLIVMLAGFGLLALVIAVTSSGFAMHAVAAGGVSRTAGRQSAVRVFAPATQKQALRRKEWKLLARDPWLLSQTLMQILYLLPPALMLWLNYGQAAGVFVVVVPVLVMAAGQLAGGLAWLAISGEDAHDLVVTAPISPRLVLTAKIEAVLFAIGVIVSPLILGVAFSSIWHAVVTAFGVVLAASSATTIQLWFRVQARRSLFRRRQVSSRTATLSEAFASIMWAGTAGLVAAGAWVFAAFTAAIAIGVLGLAYALSPRKTAGA